MDKYEKEDECPLGGDIANNCADCAYAAEYHYIDGECVRREANKIKRFYFGQHWQVYGTNFIEVPDDFTVEQAIEYTREHWSDVGLAKDAAYVQDSDEPDFECCRFE